MSQSQPEPPTEKPRQHTSATLPPGEKYEQMLQLADSFEATGNRMRERAKLGRRILADDDVTASAELSPRTWEPAEEAIGVVGDGKHSLMERSVELDADALVVRATVLTYQWIDELQNAAYKNLGEVAGRAIGYLAPEVELGGSLLAAGLIETDALDREGVTAYLGELAEESPELMEHITGGGALVESLQLRSLLTADAPRGDDAAAATEGALRAAGLAPFSADVGHALRDAAVELLHPAEESGQRADSAALAVPESLEQLMRHLLTETTAPVTVQPVAEGRHIAYLTGPFRSGGSGLRLVTGDLGEYTAEVARAIGAAVSPGDRVMLVGGGAGGSAATQLASADTSEDGFSVEQVITVGAPGAAGPLVPEPVRVLSLEDRSDPVALLGGLINAAAGNRLAVVYDGSAGGDEDPYLVGARAADHADHAELRAELARLREQGYLR